MSRSIHGCPSLHSLLRIGPTEVERAPEDTADPIVDTLTARDFTESGDGEGVFSIGGANGSLAGFGLSILGSANTAVNPLEMVFGNGGDDEDKDCRFLKNIERDILKDMVLKGIHGIKKVFMREENVVK